MVRPRPRLVAQEPLREGAVGFLLLALGFAACAQAGTSSGLTCRITTDVLDSGGRRQAAGAVSMDSSLGGFLGTGEAPADLLLAHSGYPGQLFDPRVLLASASPDVVPEEDTTQLSAIQLCDDGTRRRPDSAVLWSIVGGPVFAIDSSARAHADVVYRDETARVSASADGLSGPAEFQVTDVDPDNFGLYAGDDVADGWQVGYFGVGNPDGLAGADYDEDLQDNRYEFYAGTDPTLDTSRFNIAMSVKPTVDITFNPAFTSRTYQAVRTTNLMAGAWSPTTNAWVFIGPERGAIRDVAESNRFSAFALSIGYAWR